MDPPGKHGRSTTRIMVSRRIGKRNCKGHRIGARAKQARLQLELGYLGLFATFAKGSIWKYGK